jgi:hypothetical protein
MRLCFQDIQWVLEVLQEVMVAFGFRVCQDFNNIGDLVAKDLEEVVEAEEAVEDHEE